MSRHWEEGVVASIEEGWGRGIAIGVSSFHIKEKRYEEERKETGCEEG